MYIVTKSESESESESKDGEAERVGGDSEEAVAAADSRSAFALHQKPRSIPAPPTVPALLLQVTALLSTTIVLEKKRKTNLQTLRFTQKPHRILYIS